MFTGRISVRHQSQHSQLHLSSLFSTKRSLLFLLFIFGFVVLILVTRIVQADEPPLPDVDTPPLPGEIANGGEPSVPGSNSPDQDAMGDSMVFLPLVVSGSANVCGFNDQEQAVFDFAQVHPDQGRANVSCNAILTQVARAKAQDMAERSYFAHSDPDGLGPNYHVRTAGYVLPTWYGTAPGSNNIESIAAGYSSADSAWTGWINSSGHRTHILAESSFWQSQTNVGIGYYYDPGSPYQHYWVFLSAPPES